MRRVYQSVKLAHETGRQPSLDVCALTVVGNVHVCALRPFFSSANYANRPDDTTSVAACSASSPFRQSWCDMTLLCRYPLVDADEPFSV